MKLLALSVGLALVSTAAFSAGPPTGKEINFNGYGLLSAADKDNKSVVKQANDQGTVVKVTQGQLGVFDGNRSAVDIRLQSPGNNNNVKITQSGDRSYNDSLVKIAGTTGGADVDINQQGHTNDSVVYMANDEDNSKVDVMQNGVDHWSRVKSTGKSKLNRTFVAQEGIQNDSEISYADGSSSNLVRVTQKGADHDSDVLLSAGSSENRVFVDQGKNTTRYNNESMIDLYASNENTIRVNQRGNNNWSNVDLDNATNNTISVTQSWGDVSNVVQSGSMNSTVTVLQN
ncbi:hypothetical protein MD535_06710 [Vibrio sp. ZSDZ65]|uniref:Curlin n=1 Tax=Vibrio qingdaonensis TaxID=2829491 RepID=A0A9X3CLX6_9VIBR|nr:hypothetical protein [Vibrio qingdaonensis]MCW8345700.1 hypothetical protein [Vibrio qingdaonensis]